MLNRIIQTIFCALKPAIQALNLPLENRLFLTDTTKEHNLIKRYYRP